MILSVQEDCNAQAQPNSPSDYTCKVDQQCLNNLHNILLDKESNRGIYKYCEFTLDNIKMCCSDPSQCQEPWAKGLAQDLRSSSSQMVQNLGGDALTCQLSNLSSFINTLVSVQNGVCKIGLENCEIECENKLGELKQTFRSCFSIPSHLSIDEVLRIAENPSKDHNCYKEIKAVAQRYKQQSLDKKSLLRDDMKAKDIVNCKEIEKAKVRQNLNNFALDSCYQAQEQKKKQKEEERARKKREEEQKKRLEEEKRIREEQNRQGEAKRIEKPEALADKAGMSDKGVTSRQSVKKEEIRTKSEDQKSLKQSTSSSSKAEKTSTNKDKSLSQEGSKSNNSKDLNQSGKTREEDLLQARKGTNRSKGGVEKQTSSTGSLTGNEIKASSAENLQMAQADASSANCPVMPQIKSAVVFQSVEAPQIEPMSRQALLPYNDYDLVMGKPAGVLVELNAGRMDRGKEFAMDLFISDDTNYRRKCFHKALRGEMREGEEDFCFFYER